MFAASMCASIYDKDIPEYTVYHTIKGDHSGLVLAWVMAQDMLGLSQPVKAVVVLCARLFIDGVPQPGLKRKEKKKSMSPKILPHALRKAPLISKLARASPQGLQA
eukprot:936578-Pelagomonas_calceolata.AAC.2